MSLVLDALLKAQSQRSRGEVPRVTAGLHSLGSAPASARRASRPPWAWMLVAALLTALAAWALVSWRGAVKPGATQRVAQQSVVAPSPSPSPPQSQAIAPPAPAPTQALPSANRPVVRAPATSASIAGPVKPTRAVPAPSGPALAAAASAVRPATRAVAVVADAPAIPSRADLPPALRQALPALAVSGMVYARDPAQRMVLINGELWRQGDSVAPGLVLEEIRAKDLVLRYQGQQRFSLSP